MSKRLTYDEVKEYIESFNYELLSKEYKNNHTKLLIKCPKGHEFEMNINSFKNGQRCPECAPNKKRTYKEVKEYIESFGYKLLSDKYENNKTKLKMECPKGHIFEMKYNSFHNGTRCPKCNKTRRLTYEEVKEYVEQEGYTLISKEYTNNRNKLEMICPKGHKFKMNFNNFRNGSRCPKCLNSKGETNLKHLLKELSIDYETQYYFEDCKIRRCLPFDFYLPDYNCCIEFDGRQHFEVVNAFGGLDGFIDTKIRDVIKTEYCKSNNIKLIRIPYWEMRNMKKIITRELIN